VPDWDQEPLLGKVPDTVLARVHGVSDVAVGRARKRRGIPTFRSAGYRDKTAPGQRAGIKWDTQPLGEIPDHVLAKRLGVDQKSVESARQVRGIPRKHERLGKRVDWDHEPDLGRVPDIELAARHGVHRRTVKSARDRRGIPKLWLKEAEPVVVTTEEVLYHVHRCPVCSKSVPCHRECETSLETADFEPMLYETCAKCKTYDQGVNDGVVGSFTTFLNSGRR
jgi:hypothetical protein